jgi:acetyltransferase-like isoleucine patch superfamily enzyme
MDSNGHDTDPALRWRHEAPRAEDVRPVIIRDNVWIGRNCIIFPGVKIGEGSVISAGSVVRSHVPPYAVVAGNPAKVMFRLKKPDQPSLV